MALSIFEHQYEREGSAAQRSYPNEELLRFVGRNLFRLDHAERSRIRVLEVGCGSGANLWMLAREGFAAHGLDFSPTGLGLCRDMLASWGTTAPLICADLLDLPYPEDTFDVVVDVVSCQHLTLAQHEKALAEIFRVLQFGGRFFSYHLGAESYSFREGGGNRMDVCTIDNVANSRAPYHDNGVTCFLDPESGARLLGEAGFSNITVESVRKTYLSMTIEIQYLVLEAVKA